MNVCHKVICEGCKTRRSTKEREEEVDIKELNEQEGKISENMRLREREIKNEELSDFKRQQNQRKVSLN